jgi:hypothetical protein
VSAGLLTRNREADCVRWAQQEVEQVTDPKRRAWGRETLVSQLVDEEQDSRNEEMPMRMEREAYETMASALGIDWGNPEDPFAAMVNIGIDDLDPTRVLSNCRHLFQTLSRHSPGFFQLLLATQLQLPTMGAKVLHCSFHKYTGAGQTLDGVYERFERDY